MAGLLVSVRDAAEAVLALTAGAAILDVKDPDRGSLGQASAATVAGVLDVVAGRLPISAALGEMVEWPDDLLPSPPLRGRGGSKTAGGCESSDEIPPFVDRLAYVKWGLAGAAGQDWTTRLLRLRERVEASGACRVVIAAYADWRRAGAPAPGDVFHVAVRERFAAVLLDTWGKDGSGLLDWLSPAEVAELCRPCRAAGVRIALAGSLGASAIRTLRRHVEPDWFAVRGSVCGGDRTARLDGERVRELVELVSRTPAG
jgi:hypothetical protein